MIEMLVANGLGLLAKAGIAKGKDWLKEKTGVDLDQAALSPEDVLKLKQYEMEHETELLRITVEAANVEAQELTKRLQADMGSDSWMSKNIRPMVLAAVTVFVGIGLAFKSIEVGKFDQICTLAMFVYGFYFGARMSEKGVVERVVGAWRK